ncbi:MAG: transglycosylase SLT domain-containing protein [bacterium]|nr:transglycosylase SLT domain-containing protein [bacterium]
MGAGHTCRLWPCLGLLLVLAGTARGTWTTRYDPHFQKYSKRYFGADFDWRWWKAQAIAESALDTTARSWAGAQGMMQIMPGTWQDLAPKLGVTSPWLVKDNIQAGIYYDARMWAIWKAPRPLEERIAFTLASYNAGPGHIIKAQRLVATGMNPNHWAPVAAELHRVTGRHAEETRGYVKRIRKLLQGLDKHPP